MALTAHKQALSSNLFLKITAFVIGYSAWLALSSSQTIQITHRIPVAFYNVPDTYRIDAPDSLNITLAGKRMHLQTISLKELTLHINGATLAQGENHINLCDSSLFLPKQIEVLDYTPSHAIVHVYS